MSKNIEHQSVEEELVTMRIDIHKIPGLINNENHNQKQIESLMAEKTKEHYTLEEVFGDYCQLADYIECPLSMAYEYCANVHA